MESLTNYQIAQLRQLAENDTPANREVSDKALKTLKKINSTYHRCYEWDGMVICDKHPEFQSCLCFKKTKQL